MKMDLLFPYCVPGADYDHEREILTPLKLMEGLKWDCLLLARVRCLRKADLLKQLLGRRGAKLRAQQQLCVRYNLGASRWW